MFGMTADTGLYLADEFEERMKEQNGSNFCGFRSLIALSFNNLGP